MNNILVDNFLATIQKMERLAEIGRKRRLYRIAGGSAPRQIDFSRLHRPVFLSYCTRDTRIANGLRNNLEMQGIDVWYAPLGLRPGDPWRRCIDEAIDQASIFLALNTDSSLLSSECVGEFARFHRRLEGNLEPRPLILPVRYGLSGSERGSEVLQMFDTYQHVDLTKNYIEGLNQLIREIKDFLASSIRLIPRSEAEPGRVA